MRKSRRAAFAAAMLCYLAGALLLFGVYEGPMDATAIQNAAPGEEVRIRGEATSFDDARVAGWQGDDHAVELRTPAPVTVVVRSDDPLPQAGRWIVHGTLDARVTLDGQPYILIDAHDVTAPLLFG